MKAAKSFFGYAALALALNFLSASLHAVSCPERFEAVGAAAQAGYLAVRFLLAAGFGLCLARAGLGLLSLVPAWRRLLALDPPKR